MIGLVDGNNFFVSCERVVNPKLNGKAVAVLSNNDGCCVARSNEFKALGIPMGTPYFKLKDREATGELIFRSSNYELYGDISRRIISILREVAVDVEQYSIDEAFIWPPTTVLGTGDSGLGIGDAHDNQSPIPNTQSPLYKYGQMIRQRIKQWVGIPCGVGFAPTKTLAKIANHIGKKSASGVFVMPEDPTDILAKLPTDEVWGVGRRLPVKLRAERIHTAKDLRDAPDDVIRRVGGVTLLRTATELRGISCNQERDYNADPDSVSCSRSFGEQVTTMDALMESIASFTAQAATKLRRHGLLASGCNVYAEVRGIGDSGLGIGKTGLGIGDSGLDNYFVERTVVFPAPTDATNEMTKAIRKEAVHLFRQGCRYRKSGVIFFGLEKVGATYQPDLFPSPQSLIPNPHSPSKLYETIDALNAKLGKGKVFSAAEGVGTSAWRMKRSKLSKRATTNWDELITVR